MNWPDATYAHERTGDGRAVLPTLALTPTAASNHQGEGEIAERLALAAARLDDPEGVPFHEVASGYALRPDQVRVFHDCAAFLHTTSLRQPELGSPFGRLILPPRTGKTVIAGHLIARSGLPAVFLVPTRTLVEQTARELARQLPGTPIGVYFGERKDLVTGGVNIATYALLQRVAMDGALPPQLASALLIFADEAHHAMTPPRLRLLRSAFAPGAARIGLTATPDYRDQRVLCRYFPDLIHEVTLEDAVTLGLLAPLRMWLAEVDAEGSRVRVVAGDYDEAALGRVMSEAPFLHAVQWFRYHPKNLGLPSLVACASRQQAHDLYVYLQQHRPPGTPPPGLVLGDTPRGERERVLAAYERGELDTLLQVGVLIEGWNSPRCKLLIDLAPSLSRVRATQKFFRVMTRQGDAEARIYVLIPKGLPQFPILPSELFGPSAHHFIAGELIGKPSAGSHRRLIVDSHTDCPIAGVTLKQRILCSYRFAAPQLLRDRPEDVRAVLKSNPEFDWRSPCGVYRFAAMVFSHPVFMGRGETLLRWYGVTVNVSGYLEFLSRVWPTVAANYLLAQSDGADTWRLRRPRAEARQHKQAAWGLPPATVLRAPTPLDPLVALLQKEDVAILAAELARLPGKRGRLAAQYYGLLGAPELSLQELADEEEVSRSRIGQHLKVALRSLRHRLHWEAGYGLAYRFRYRRLAAEQKQPLPLSPAS